MVRGELKTYRGRVGAEPDTSQASETGRMGTRRARTNPRRGSGRKAAVPMLEYARYSRSSIRFSRTSESGSLRRISKIPSTASRQPRSIDQVAELKVSLSGSRPPIWRRIRLPVTATLSDLHEAVQVLYGWDGDHLHVFRAGKKQYSDPLMNLEGTADEDAVRVRDVLAPGGQIRYTYDLGACWEHEIALEKLVARDPGQVYPVCVAYKGDSPVGYWSEDDPTEPEPFNLAEVNRTLAAPGETEE